MTIMTKVVGKTCVGFVVYFQGFRLVMFSGAHAVTLWPTVTVVNMMPIWLNMAVVFLAQVAGV